MIISALLLFDRKDFLSKYLMPCPGILISLQAEATDQLLLSTFQENVTEKVKAVSKEFNNAGIDVSLDEARYIIRNVVDAGFVKQVRKVGRYLYRGENVDGICLLNPKPDLLDLETYNDSKALAYFHQLENELVERGLKSDHGGLQATLARPSNGHIVTPNKKDAELWGNAVSIWPLGGKLSFVYPQNRSLFWPLGTDASEEFVVGSNIEYGLRDSKEILFTGSYACSFLAVPSRFDQELF